ncbi:MAG: protein kinase [Labilithrix sp.]
MFGVRRYRVVGQLGRGGMAEVLEAQAMGEAGFERRVAIKRMLPAAASDASSGRMFVDEARIASQLHHANIVSILDYGIVDGTPFQVLEFVDGADGRTLVRKSEAGRLPVDVALHLCAQVGHALSYAHAARDERGAPLGIVHRDVTPGNVLVSWEGDVKLADFGIAFSENRTEVTEYGMTKGTPSYMSPEQALGVPVDARADVFSLGCVLHMLLTGSSPLAKGAHLDFYTKHVLELAPDLPDDVTAIIRQATFFDRADRFSSAGAMTEALGQALAARSARDPRMALKSFVAPMRPPQKVAVAKLDHLFEAEIVFTDEVDGTRRFSLLPGGSGTAPLLAAGAPISEPELPRAPEPALPAPLPAPSSAAQDTTALVPIAGLEPTPRWPFAAAAIVTIAAGVAGITIWQRNHRGAGDGLLPPAPSVASAAPSATTSLVPLPPAATAEAQPTAAPAPLASGRTRLPSPPLPAGRPTVTAARSAVPAPTGDDCRGTVYVNCTAATRAHILLDGHARSERSGDRIADVGCGTHTVTFVDSSKGTRAVSVTVERGQLTSAACGFPSD